MASAFFHEVNAEHPDWLAMFLGGHDVHGYEERSERVLLSRGSTQCHAYLVNPPGMWRLVDHLWCRPFEIVDGYRRHRVGAARGSYGII